MCVRNGPLLIDVQDDCIHHEQQQILIATDVGAVHFMTCSDIVCFSSPLKLLCPYSAASLVVFLVWLPYTVFAERCQL